MNVFKTPSKRKCAFIYMNEISEKTDNMIRDLDKNYDVYVYFHKNLNIYVGNYCSLNPVTGFIEGRKGNAEGIWELITSIGNEVVSNSYFLYYFPTNYDINQDPIDEIMAGGLLEKSIMPVTEIEHNFKSKVYRKGTWDWMRFWDKNDKDIHTTNSAYSDMVILYTDISSLVKSLSKDYIRTFRDSVITSLIPSAFHHLNMSYLNADIHHIKERPPYKA